MCREVYCVRQPQGAACCALRWFGLALVALIVSSCSSTAERSNPTFKNWYQLLEEHPADTVVRSDLHRVTISASGIPIEDFCRRLVDLCGISVIVSKGYADSVVSAEFTDQPVDQVLSVVSRRVGCQMSRLGDIYFLGDLKSEDKAILVRRVRRLSSSALSDAAKTLLSENGRLVVAPDGLVVAADRVEVVARLSDLFDQVEHAPSSCWVFQLWVMSLGDLTKSELGLNFTQTIELSGKFGNAGHSWMASVAFDALLHAVYTSSDSKMIISPCLLIEDGSDASWSSGIQVPVARKSVSQYGAVQTLGYDLIQTGLVVEMSLRETELDAARLGLHIQQSAVDSYVDNAYPVVNKSEIKNSSLISQGGVYLLGTLRSDRKQSGMSNLVYQSDKQASELQIWGRGYRIAPVPRSPSLVRARQPLGPQSGGDPRSGGTAAAPGASVLFGPPSPSKE